MTSVKAPVPVDKFKVVVKNYENVVRQSNGSLAKKDYQLNILTNIVSILNQIQVSHIMHDEPAWRENVQMLDDSLKALAV